MRALTQVTACTLVVTAASCMPAAAAADGTLVALDGKLRHCDWSQASVSPMVSHPEFGSGFAMVRTSGSQVSAEVHLADPTAPGTHFDVGLIEMPRPSSATCGPGDPGTAFTGLDTDGAGNGTATVQEGIRPGTTGVWVMVARPNSLSQNPAEFYTSEFVAPV
jgi:hypothetical protein